MAKAHPQSSERSKVRFMLVEFDGASNDLQQLAQTFANAVKPTQIVMQQAMPHLLAGTVAPTPIHVAPEDPSVSATESVTADSAEDFSPVPKSQNGTKKKALRTPQYLTDLEFKEGEKPLADYMKELGFTSDTKRYLAITKWLQKYRNLQEVGADHVFTSYRFLNLTVPEDVLGVFRALKKKQWVSGGSKAGSFKITHTGENQLIKGTE